MIKIFSKHRIGLFLAILAVSIFACVSVQASVIVTPASSPNEADFDSLVSATDLINSGQPSFVSASEDIAPRAGSITATNDGVSTPASLATKAWYDMGFTPDTPTRTLTYMLNTNPSTGGSELGYDITGVNVFESWANLDMFCGQKWTMRVATVANPVFADVALVDYAPSGAASSMVSVTDSTGTIASGVTAVQFTFQPVLVNDILLGEIDVTGVATVPEPSTIALLAFACLAGLIAIRRRS
jgi:hypothetical protein